jgi:NAD(P)H dehydrogenase (quinone)
MSQPDPVVAPSHHGGRVLIVYAHPEPQSLNGMLKDFMCERLAQLGHEVRVSDLYAMGWKAPVDDADFPARDRSVRLDIIRDSGLAYAQGTQPDEVTAEQEKLRWADLLILQFPLWWFSMPAILKGWVDRVYAYGFAYGVGEHSSRRWGERYGEGVFKGKRAMLVVTAGGWQPHYSERGINGAMDDVLFPINHGVLYYPGFEVLPPFVVYRAGSIDAERLLGVQRDLQLRLDTLWTQAPIRYRAQNAGDYDIPALTLKPGRESDGRHGFGLHVGEAIE